MRDTSKADGSAVRPNEQKLNTARSLGLSLLEAACIAVRAAGPGTVERAAADARIRELIAELAGLCLSCEQPRAVQLLEAARNLGRRTAEAPRYGDRRWTEACIELNSVLGALASEAHEAPDQNNSSPTSHQAER